VVVASDVPETATFIPARDEVAVPPDAERTAPSIDATVDEGLLGLLAQARPHTTISAAA
jgi:hypothetical protein